MQSIACDTDGIDASEDNAGIWIAPDTVRRAAQARIDAKADLANNVGHGFFQGLDALLVTGPTLTNVNDFRADLVLPNPGSASEQEGRTP